MEGNSLASFENLCRIFEMRIKLDKEKGIKTPLEVISNYEKYSKKIDVIYNTEFQKELKPLISPAITLEKEKDRLRRLIKLLEERLSKRTELEDSFYETTGKYLSGLQIIVSDYELEDKKERLSLISRYLETRDEIESVTNSINELNKELDEEERKLVEYEIKNKIIEDELYTTFMKIINTDEYFKSINIDAINSELDKIKESVRESKETLDITKDSIGSLVTNGLEDDYTSYIEEAEKNYYNIKNKEIILKIYKLVANFEDDFKLICAKREKIIELLDEKKEIGNSLVLDIDNELVSFEQVVTVQNNTLDNERETIDNITNYNSRINFKEERLEELKEVNNAVEILSILREYGVIETYDTEDVFPEEKETESIIEGNDFFEKLLDIPKEEVQEDTIVEEFYDPYRIVEISDYPKTLNVGLAKLKGESVREKVNKKLNPKEEKIINIEETISNLESNIDTKKREELVDLSSIDIPEVEIETKSEDEIIDIPNTESFISEENNQKLETPIWELPSETSELKNGNDKQEEINALPVWNTIDTSRNIDNKSNTKEEQPVWKLPTEITDTINVGENTEEISSLPIWDVINKNDSKQNITEEIKEAEDNSDLFWLPVSDTKVNNGSFPSLNIPVNSDKNKESNFVFPTINN